MAGAHGACGIPMISKTSVNWLNPRNDELVDFFIYIYIVEIQEAEGQRGNKGGACWEEDKAFLSHGTWDQVKFNRSSRGQGVLRCPRSQKMFSRHFQWLR